MSDNLPISQMREEEQQEIFDECISIIRPRLEMVSALAVIMRKDTIKEWNDLVLDFNSLLRREY